MSCEINKSLKKSAAIKIIGFGNIFMGDDAIGIRVLEEIKKQDIFKDNENVELIEGGTSGVDLIFILQNADKAIIVDAVNAGQPVGQITVFNLKNIKEFVKKKKPLRSFSFHDIDLLEIFELINTLKIEKDIIIVGINPKKIGYSDKLSDEIEKKIPEIILQVKKEAGV